MIILSSAEQKFHRSFRVCLFFWYSLIFQILFPILYKVQYNIYYGISDFYKGSI